MIIILGVPGAGKSTILSAALQKVQGWRVANWGDRMVQIAQQQHLVQNRDELRKLPVAVQKKLQRSAAISLAREKGNVILDTHPSIATPEGYFPGLPFDLLKRLPVTRLVLIEAPLQDILRRRKSDTTRIREADEALVSEQLFVNRSLLCTYSALSGAPISFITNADGKLEEAAGKLASLLK